MQAEAEVVATLCGYLASRTQGIHIPFRDVVHEQREGLTLRVEGHGRTVLKDDVFKQIGGLVEGCPVIAHGIQVDAVLVLPFSAEDGSQLCLE